MQVRRCGEANPRGGDVSRSVDRVHAKALDVISGGRTRRPLMGLVALVSMVACTARSVDVGTLNFVCQRQADCGDGFVCASSVCTLAENVVDAGRPLPHPLRQSLVSYWAFDVDGRDAVGANHVIDAGIPTAPGKLGKTYDFATQPALLVRDADSLSFTDAGVDTAFTWSMWVQPDVLPTSLATRQWLLSKRGANTEREYQIVVDVDGAVLVALMGARNIDPYLLSRATTRLVVNRWNHLVVTFDGSKTFAGITVFIDGVESPTEDQSVGTYQGTANGSSDLTISSASWDPGTAPVRGAIDEVAVWRRALGTDDVARLWNGGDGLAFPFSP